MPTDKKAFIVGISGCSCSGKSTIAHVLQSIFPKSGVVHEDDFYKQKAAVPSNNGFLDWDCADAVNFRDLADALSHVEQHASVPPSSHVEEHLNLGGKCSVTPSTIAALRSKVSSLLPHGPVVNTPRFLCLVEGFLLYGPSMALIQPKFDLKFFLRASYAQVKARRLERNGYIVREGYWADPPAYLEKVVWHNYANYHAWMFENGDVEGRFREDVLERVGIEVLREAPVDADIETLLRWMVDKILDGLLESS